jgi:nucleotide-binding universal stress UspA family protein
MEKVLVAVDGSEASLDAARWAAEIAARFGASLRLVHVIPKVPLPADVYGLKIAELEREHHEYAAGLLEKAVARVARPGLRTETAVLDGSPAERIAEEAAAPEIGMVVVGSRGHGAVVRVLLGSVSDRLVHISAKPVLVVH